MLTSGFPEETGAPDPDWSPGTVFMSKPFTPAELTRRVRDVLDTPNPGA